MCQNLDQISHHQHYAQVRGRCSKRAKSNNHELLNQCAARLAQWVADHVDSSLPLHLQIAKKGYLGV